MNHRVKTAYWIPMLALSMTLAVAGSATAQGRYDDRTSVSGSLEIRFGSQPHWTNVGSTRVQVIRSDERPDYDMFRYGDRYYVYRDNRWYSSNQWSGSFHYIDGNAIPMQLREVPREHWRQYPNDWNDRYDDDRDRRYDRDGDRRDGYRDYDRDGVPGDGAATFELRLGTRPRWSTVSGTRVMMVRQSGLPYDVFRYGNRYYVYNDSRWYMSNRWDGTYSYIDARMVPAEFSRVPRRHWRHYPQGWANRRDNRDNRNDRYDDRGRRY